MKIKLKNSKDAEKKKTGSAQNLANGADEIFFCFDEKVFFFNLFRKFLNEFCTFVFLFSIIIFFLCLFYKMIFLLAMKTESSFISVFFLVSLKNKVLYFFFVAFIIIK